MNPQRILRNRWMAIFFIFFSILFIIIFIRFLTIQISGEAKGKNLARLAYLQHKRSYVLEANRGNIFDHNGKVIATNTDSYNLIAILDPKMTIDKKEPHHVINYQETASELSEYINLSENDIYKILYEGKQNDQFQVEFGSAGKDISKDVRKKIKALKLPGIIFETSKKRYYPNGIFASNLIGYTGKKNQFTIGKMGIEETLDKYLQEQKGMVKFSSDKFGLILPNAKKEIQKPKNGDDIYLTLDKNIQIILDEALNNVEKKYNPKKIMAVVADPKTGKILGMSQRPTFDPMTREGIENAWTNEIVETSYEPGSVMKIFTLASAVQEGVFNPNEKYLSGKFFVKGVPNPIKDHNYGVGWGEISYLKGLQRSSNVAFAKLLDKIGQDKYRNYLDAFHFGQSTNIGLPNESTGKILYNWPIEKYTTTFGQGTTVTALQMVQAATAIANNGKMMKPYVIDKIVDSKTKTTKLTEPEVVGTPISSETAKQVRDYLRTVISSKDGTGKMYNIPGYSVIGKTGTAQIPKFGGGYLSGANDYIYSFLGMAPKDNPKLIVYVVVQQPQLDNKTNGATPVKMIFNPVMKNSLQYLSIEPNNTSGTKKVEEILDYSSKSITSTTKDLENKGFEVIVLGTGNTVVDQWPKKTSLIKGEKVIIKTDGELRLPDMKNWSKKDVLKVSELLKLKIKIKGYGYLVNQSISPNSVVKLGDKLQVDFKAN
ncbi:penicillin-binding protein 2B [Heyndrickxia sporothermodurans]|nr:penicillin-binding protein 2B [Heyndrickxia sporothermodurans]